MRKNQPMTRDEINRSAPSVFAETPATHTSDRYKFIPTVHVLDLLQAEGWQVVAAFEQRVNKQEKQGTQKHSLRLRHESMNPQGLLTVGEIIPEMNLTNAHDGTAVFSFEGGIYRCVCANQMTVADAVFGAIKVKHIGFQENNVIEASYEIIENTPKMIESVNGMQEIMLTEEMKRAFAKSAIQLKWPDGSTSQCPVEPDQLLRQRRWGDDKSDLWTVFNTVQENMIRGGIRGLDANGRRRRTRAVTSISEDKRLNKALWTLAEEMKTIIK